MTRTAEHSISGYLYQFTKYLIEILASLPGETTYIEGTIEDVEIHGPSSIKAIQCKYHESQDVFALSSVYKPIIQMYDHYSSLQNHGKSIDYVLFCHFPSKSGKEDLSSNDFDTVLSTKDEKLLKIIGKISSPAPRLDFLSRLTICFGPSLDELIEEAMAALCAEGLNREDVEGIFFPNSIHAIFDIARNKDALARSVEKGRFLSCIRQVKTLAISRWTRELKTKRKIFDAIRLSMMSGLKENIRKRLFIIRSGSLEDFSEGIVLFIRNFLSRYNSKPYLHTEAPTFLFDIAELQLQDIISRLYELGIKAECGLVGFVFKEEEFYKHPIVTGKKSGFQRQFSLRIAHISSTNGLSKKWMPEDVYIVGDGIPLNDFQDFNVFQLDVSRTDHLSYLFSIGEYRD